MGRSHCIQIRLMRRLPCRQNFQPALRRNTQLILQHETGVTDVVDPLAGSYYFESLTKQLADEAWKLIEEVEEMGGMTKAVEAGLPKLRIEEASAQKQASVDRGETIIVGVNKYKLETQDEIDILQIDNDAVREAQVARLNRMRKSRDEKACKSALDATGQLCQNWQRQYSGICS